MVNILAKFALFYREWCTEAADFSFIPWKFYKMTKICIFLHIFAQIWILFFPCFSDFWKIGYLCHPPPLAFRPNIHRCNMKNMKNTIFCKSWVTLPACLIAKNNCLGLFLVLQLGSNPEPPPLGPEQDIGAWDLFFLNLWGPPFPLWGREKNSIFSRSEQSVGTKSVSE